MRNQEYSNGKVVIDNEVTKVDGVITVRDLILNITRLPTPREESTFLLQENIEKKATALAAFKSIIESNKATSPWGIALYNLAIYLDIIK